MNTSRITGLLALALIFSGCTTATNEISLDDAVNSIVSGGVKAHYEVLADDAMEGRMTGEPGYDKAADYVAGQFEALGLTPGGDAGSWYQQVTFQSYLIDTESAVMIVHRDGVDTELTYREDFGMFSDRVRGFTEVRAEVVYAGYGVHAPEFGYSDYDNVDVDGKIVAIFNGAPPVIEGTKRSYFSSARTKAREAVSRGAVGFVSLRSRRSVERFAWERWKKTMGTRPGLTWLSDNGDAAGFFAESRGSVIINEQVAADLFEGSPLSFEAARDAAEDSTPASTPLGLEVTLKTTTKHEQFTSPNVIGIVRGSDPVLSDEYVVYTAHLDHLGRSTEIDGDDLYNGAYDNAMGVALMIETARAFAEKPPRRSVMFIALTGEERGLLGSDYFVNYPTVPAESLVANVNLDMPLFLHPLADLVAFGAEHSSLQATVADAVAVENFELSPDPMPEQNLFARSDQFSFVQGGIPAIFLVPGYKSLDPEVDGEALFNDHLKNHYHKPSDDLALPVVWSAAERFARANARIGYSVANDDNRPRWNEGDFYGEKYGRDSTAIASSD